MGATTTSAAPFEGRHFVIGRFPGFATTSWLFMVYLYLPILLLIIFSFNSSRSATIWEGFSLEWYVKAFSNDDVRRAAVNSLIVATSATIVATIAAVFTALTLTRGGAFRGKSTSYGILVLPMIMPEIVTAVATLSFFTALHLDVGLLRVIIAHTVFCIPFAFMPIRARLQGMDTTLEQAAQDLYANEWKAFRYVTLPLLMPGIISGAMLSFIVSIDDFIITLMVAPAGSTTLPLYIYGMVRMGVTPEVNALSTVMLLISISFVSASYVIAHYSRGSASPNKS